VENELSEIARMADIVQAFGTTHSFGKEVVEEINLALEEIISNIIVHGYGDGENQGIDVSLTLSGDVLRIVIKDDAKPFNPLSIDEPDIDVPFEDREIGGLGVFLTKQVMDKLEYEVRDGRNVLLLEKQVS
jgi:anti-sigma regulatory factor (Ser/Thr protein kinase)